MVAPQLLISSLSLSARCGRHAVCLLIRLSEARTTKLHGRAPRWRRRVADTVRGVEEELVERGVRRDGVQR